MSAAPEAISRLPAALEPLVAERRWVVWRWERTAKGEKTKVPYQASHPKLHAKSNGPSTWGTYQDAVAVVGDGEADGIGFMLRDGEIAAFDIDDCRDPQTGKIAAWAWLLINQAASYAEVTVSGTGIRIIGRATGPHVHRNQPWAGANGRVETYRRAARYIVVTGAELPGAFPELADIDAMIDDVVARLDAEKAQPKRGADTAAEFDFNRASKQRDDPFGFSTSLPTDLDQLIRYGVPEAEDRSEHFHHAVRWLKDLGWGVDDIHGILARFPNGIAEKYASRGRDQLRINIQNCFNRPRKDRDHGKADGAKTEQPKEPPQPILLRWHGDADPYADRAWLVRELIPEVGKGLLSGQWGAGKTFGALDLSASIMAGEPFAGRRVNRRGGVLFIAPEGAYEIPIRLSGIVEGKLRGVAFAQAAGGAQKVNPDRLPIAWIDECPRLIERGAVEVLKATARAAADRLQKEFQLPLALIIIDTIAASAGFDDENSAAESQRVMDAMQALSNATGAFVLGVDHFGKMVETGTRGSSGKEAAVDVVLAMLADKDVTGTISNTRMAVRKLRGGKTGDVFPYSLDVVKIGENRFGEPITTCVVAWQEAKKAEEKTTRETWPQSLRVFRTAMQTALIDHGREEKPLGIDGPKVKAVVEAKVRAEFNLSYPVEGETNAQRADAKRNAFNRAMKSALGRQLVASRDLGGLDFLWFTDGQP